MSNQNGAAVQTFLTNLNNLQAQKGDSLSIDDIDHLLTQFDGSAYNDLITGLHKISGKMANIKLALSESPETINDQKIPNASETLKEVVASTEQAANRIMDAAENIQNAADGLEENKQQPFLDAVTEIFEASNFQDINGQRINNVINELVAIDTIVKTLLDAVSEHVELEAAQEKVEESLEKSLMNGPQSDNTAPDQADIDKLFDSV